jgi:hypothetical protein
MIKKALIVLFITLILVSCDFFRTFFSASSFPAHLGLVEKMVDLSEYMKDDPDDCWDCYELHFMNGFVFLVVQNSRLFIFDENLKELRDPYRDRPYGSLGFFDGARYIFGEFEYDDDPPDFTENWMGNFPNHGYGFSDGAGSYSLATENDDRLKTYVPGMTIIDDADAGSRRLTGLAYDDKILLPDPNVWLFFERDHDDEKMEAINVESNVINGGLFNTTGINYSFGYPIIELPPSDRGRYYYTTEGFVGFWRGTLRFVGFDGKIKSSLPGIDLQHIAMAFDMNGEFFFLYDGEEKALYRCRTWWPK